MKIDGKQIAHQILIELKEKTELLKEKNIIPHMVVILVGNDPASKAYVRQKNLKALEIGAKVTVVELEKNISKEKLLNLIKKFDKDKDVHGIIVQRPLPPQINKNSIDLSVSPEKDIDSFHPKSKFPMPLAQAVLRILNKVFEETQGTNETDGKSFVTSGSYVPSPSFKGWLKSKKIVVVGKGESGGGPVIEMLKKMKIDPEVIDSKTKNRKVKLKKADIVVSAVGKPGIITSDNLKKNVVLISVGMFREEDGKLHGDYEQEDIENKVLFFTPVPGGVGPVNVAMLLENLIAGASKHSFD